MRICVNARYYPPAFSGAGRQAAALVEQLTSLGVEVDVLTLQRASTQPAREQRERTLVRRLRGPWGTGRLSLLALGLFQCYWLLRHAARLDFLLFVSIGPETYLPTLLAWLIGTPVAVRTSLAGSDDLQTLSAGPVGRMRAWVLGKAAAVICPSDHTYRRCQSAATRAANRPPCVLIPNGVDVARFAPATADEKQALRADHGIEARELVGIFVGWMHPRKAPDHVIREWAAVHRKLRRTRLLLVGPRRLWSVDNSAYLQQLDQLIEAENLGAVTMWLETEDVRPYLAMSDVFLFASHEEGFPNALLEAMSSGLPPFVVARAWLSAKLLRSGETGFPVAATPGAMAAAILGAVAEGRLPAVGAAARRHVVEVFSIRRTAETYLALVAETAAGRPVPCE